jgi:hypothetical protein
VRILIATPSGRGLFSGGFVTSLLDMMSMLRSNDYGDRVDWAYMAQALISRSRNSLVMKALRDDYDVLWMIDDDMVWTREAVETVLRVLEAGVPIVAVAATKRSYPLTFPVRFVEGSEKVITTDAMVKISVREAQTVGTGFMAIRTKALVEMSKHVTTYDDIDGLKTFRFFYEASVNTPNGKTLLLGEDESFVITAREMGFKTIVPIDVKIGHEGMHVFEGSVGADGPQATVRVVHYETSDELTVNVSSVTCDMCRLIASNGMKK